MSIRDWINLVEDGAEVADREPRISWKTLPLTDPLVVENLSNGASIMLRDSDRVTRRNVHYKARKDAGGWHIRYGKRGTIKQYLTVCEVTYSDGEPLLFQFRTVVT